MSRVSQPGTPAAMQQAAASPGLTRLSKFISVLLAVAYGASLVPPTSSYLALVPGRTLPCVWNLLTAGFIANSWVEVSAWRDAATARGVDTCR